MNVLSREHQALAERFAGRGGVSGAARYAGESWFTLATGASALADAVAIIDCRVEEILERHSHAILIGRVQAVHLNGGDALLYGDGRFGRFRPNAPGRDEGKTA